MNLFYKGMILKLLVMGATLAFANSNANEPFFPKLVVSGSSLLHKPADQLTLSISVVTQGENAEKALSANNSKMQPVLAALQKVGLAKGEYETGRFNIQPVYSTPPKNPPSDWRAVIVGYNVNNTINVRTSKLDLAPAIIDAVSGAGANQIDNINFGLQDPQKYRSEAIAAAAANAIADAKALAEAANLKLVRVLEASLDQPQVYPRSMKVGFAMAQAEGGGTPIEAGDVEVSSRVSLTYEVSGK